MEILKYICYTLFLVGFANCGVSADKNTKGSIIEQNSVADVAFVDSINAISLINEVYNKLVFGIDSQGDVKPETYFTGNALTKLQEDYEFDCDDGPCYAFYALRTDMQDSNPETDGVSQIYNIEADGYGWYIVSYSDMGWTGKTRIKISDGKIDDYERMSP